MKKILSSFLLVISLSSCVASSEKRGYVFDLADHYLLQEGITSKETVLKIMGSPTIISDATAQEDWIYYSEEVKTFLFFLPKITSRTVFVVKFDESNSVKELQKFDLASEEKGFKFTSEYTAVDSHKTGFFKSIFSNVGQIKPQ